MRGLLSRRRFVVFTVALLVASVSAAAWAYWTVSATTGSAGGALATSVDQGATPSPTVNADHSVTLTWSATTLANGEPVDGYVVTRYEATSPFAAQTIQPGCDGVVYALTCTETAVAPGSWQYTITPVKGTHWTGPESVKSGVVTLAAILTLDKTIYGLSDFGGGVSDATVTGSLTGFVAHEGITYRLDSGPGTTLSGTPSSANGSGNASVSITLPRPSDGPHTIYALGDASPYASQASASILVDTVAPTVTATLSPAANAAGWNKSTSVEVSLSANDGALGSGVSEIKYTTDGSEPTTSGTAQVYAAAFDVTSNTTVKYFASDAAGNSSTVQTQEVKIDTIAPVNHLSLNLTGGSALLSGTTLWYRGVAAGSFTIANALTDNGGSGTASTGYAALSGTSTGWSFTSSSVTSGPPYVSNAFSWTAGTTSSPGEDATGYDVADNFTSASLAFANDSTGPTSGSVDATGLVGTGGRYSTSTSLSITFSKGTDAGVGLAASGATLSRAEGTLSSSDGALDGTCSGYGSFVLLVTDPAGPLADTVSDDGACYRYRYAVSDKLGNTTIYTSPDIKIDTTDPSTPTSATITPVAGAASQFVSGSTVFYNPAQAGSFSVDSSTNDGESGIASVLFPTVGGFSGGGAVSSPTSGTTYRATYSWSSNGASASPGTLSITSTNNASLPATNSSAFTITKDATAPSGGSVDASGLIGTGARYSNTKSLSIAFSKGSDNVGGSGLAFSGATLWRAEGTLSSGGTADGACSSYGSYVQIATDPGSPFANTVPDDNHCYLFQYRVSDNVGNTALYTSGDVKVETTAPASLTPTVSLGSTTGNTFVSGTTVYTNPQAGKSGSFQASAAPTDAFSGIQKVNFPALTGFTSGGGDVTSSPYQTSYAWSGAGATASGSQTVTATDNATLTATAGFTVTPDTTAPSGGSVDATGLVGTGSRYSTPTTLLIALDPGTDASGSGLVTSSALLQREQGTLSSSDGQANGTCDYTGASFSTIATGPSSPYSDGALTGISTGHCYLYRYVVSDHVGNQTTYTSGDVKVQTIAAAGLTPSITLSNATGNTFVSGTTAFINPQTGKSGSFKVAAASSDAVSGMVKVNFPGLTGFTSGGGDVAAPGPYETTYSWSGTGATASGAKTVTGTNNATLTATSAFTVTPDSTAPSGGSVDATGLVGTGGRYSTSTTLAIAFSKGADGGGSGVAATGAQLLRASTALFSTDGQADGTCGAYSGFAPLLTDPSSPYADNAAGGISAGNCYRYEYIVSDNVGNQTIYTSGDIKVETAPPASLTPSITLSAAAGNTFISGTTVYTNPQAGKSGSFQTGATASDATSGMLKVNFPSLTGFTSGGGDDSSSPFLTTYNWSGAGASASGSKTVTATDNATLPGTAAFTVTPDTTNPTISASAKKADLSTYTAGTWTNQTVTVHYTCSDGGSGLGSCTGDQTFSSDGVTSSTSGTATDNVGNSASASFGPIQVDKTNPTITASAKNADNSTYTAGTWTKTSAVTVHYTCSDPTVNAASSGVASCPADQVFSAEGTTSSTSGTATDNAGNQASASFGPIQIDRTNPTNLLSLINQGTQTEPGSTTSPTSFLSGTTVFYDQSATTGRTFQVQNAVTDDRSGPASSTFANLAGTTTNWTFTGSTVSTPSGGPYPSSAFTWTTTATASPTETVTATDAAGNTNTAPTLTFTNDKTAPATSVITFPANNGDYTNTAWDASAGACAAGTVCGTATDAGSNIGKVLVSIQATSGPNISKYWDPSANGGLGGFTSTSEVVTTATGTTSWSLAFPSSRFGDAAYTLTAYAVDNVGNNKTATAAFTIDNVAPTSSASLSPVANAAGWNKANVTVTLTGADAVSGLKSITYSATGAQPISSTTVNTSSSTTVSITTEGTTTISFHSTDNAGNLEGPDDTQVVKLDKTTPTNSLSLVNQGTVGGNATSFLSGTKIYYNGSASTGRTFQIQNAVADTLSGQASSLFGALGGTPTGFTFSTSTVSTPTGGPYVSNTFTWSSPTTSAPTENVTGADVAGNTLATGNLTLTNDIAPPTTTATPTPAPNGNGWNNANVSVGLSGTDGTGAGAASITYSATGAQTISSTTVSGSSATVPTITTEGTTTISYFSTDNVGNVETTKTQVVKIDKTTPGAPTTVALANGGGVGSSYINNANVSSVSVTVSGIAEVSASDTITVTLSDGTHTVTGTAAAGSSSVTVTGINTTTLNNGTGNITISATETDQAGNASGSTSATTNYNKDTVSPAPSTGITLGGNNNGIAEVGDSVAIVFSEKINASSFCSSWSDNTNSSTLSADNDVTVTITQSTNQDLLSVGSGSCAFHFASSLNLKKDYVTATATYFGTGTNASKITWNPSTLTLTITLGAKQSGTLQGAQTAAAPVYAADAALTDLAGNGISTSAVTAATSTRF
jgi:hypothetical protein